MAKKHGYKKITLLQRQFSQLHNQIKAQVDVLNNTHARIHALEIQHRDECSLYNILFEQSPLIKLLINPGTYQIVDANHTACRFYGYEKAIMTTMTINQIFTIPDEEISQIIKRVVEKQKYTFYSKHRCFNGEVHDVEVFLSLIKVQGKIYINSDVYDLTEDKSRDVELRLLWHALNQNTTSVIITNRDGDIEYVNPYFTQLTGYTLVEVIGKKLNIFNSNSIWSDEYKNLWQTIGAGKPWIGEYHNQKKSGEFYWVSANISPIIDEDGNITHFVTIQEDITKRMLAERELAIYATQLEKLISSRTAQLERVNERMNTVLNNVSTPVLLIDADGRIDITNPAFNRKLGYQADELFRHKLWSIFGEANQAQLIALLNDIENDTEPFQAQLIAKDGSSMDAEVTLTHLSGNDNAVVCTLYDISHLKEVERVKDSFISMVSHELRTPITSIMLSINTMIRFYHQLNDDQKRQKLTQMLEQSQTLSELVTSILDVARFSTRENKRGESTIDMAQVLHDVASEYIDQAMAHNKQIHIEVINSATYVRGNHTDMIRIWNNLLSNAIKYTSNGCEITAKIYGGISEAQLSELSDFRDDLPKDILDGGYIIGLVKDNGHGIRSEDTPQMFTRFFRGWATSTNILGTGLGLSFVRDLLRLYGGDITFRSKLDFGTTFCFWLLITESPNDSIEIERGIIS